MKRKMRATLVTTLMIGVLIHSDLQFPKVVTSRNDILIFQTGEFIQMPQIEKKEKEIVKEVKKKKKPKRKRIDKDILNELVPSVKPLSDSYSSEERELAQLLEAEAGTQGFYGKQLVADVVLNRVDSNIFPNTIHGVIFDPYQFSVIFDGRFDEMATRVSEESLKAARTEMVGPRLDYGILYFNSGSYCMNGSGAWKYKDHWFAY